MIHIKKNNLLILHFQGLVEQLKQMRVRSTLVSMYLCRFPLHTLNQEGDSMYHLPSFYFIKGVT